MASSISAGTTTSTGLVCTADTTGALVLQTNNGTTAVTIDTSQNVGIGTTSPNTGFGLSSVLYNSANTGTVASNAYNLVQSVNRNAVIELSGVSTATNAVNFSTTPGTAVAGVCGDIANQAIFFRTGGTTERMRIDSGGNVGIGTNSPSTYGKLAVVSSTAGAAKISIQDTSAGAAAPLLQFGLNDTGGFNTSDAARIWTIAATTSVASLNFSAYNGGAPSTAQMVLTGGKVGIGTTSPGANLEVKGASGQNIYVSYTSGSQLRLKSDSGDSGVGTTGSTPLLFLINNGEVGRFDTSGNLNVVGNFINNAGGFQIIQSGITVSVTGKTKVTYACTGAQQTFTVPAGVTYIYVKCWGAGGAGGNAGGWGYGADGGGGGHTRGLIPVTPGEVLQIVVGQGGQTNGNYPQTNNYGGGGGFYSNSDNRYAGAGGGYCGIFRTSVSQANALLIAGGGGGGGCSRMQLGNWGGAGGGTTGQTGNSPYDTRYSSAGGPGTQTAGGTAGVSQGATGGGAGALVGGYGASQSYGGGGGGGYFGGGGGGYYESNTMAGGGGGSGYIGATIIYGATFTGFRNIPAMSEDSDLPKTYDGYNNWQKFATGGDPVTSASTYTTAGGGSGYLVIYY